MAALDPAPGTRRPGPVGGRSVLTLHVAPRLEPLAEVLAESLRGLAARDGGLGLLGQAPVVVVPGAAAQRALTLELSRRLGVASNLRFVVLERLLESLVPEPELPRARLLDREALHAVLVGLLAPARLEAIPELTPALTYLRAAGPADAAAGADVVREAADAVDRRRVELAERLATLFERYGLERPELVRAWDMDRAADVPAEAPHALCEPWQRRLWRDVFGPAGRLSELAQGGGPEWVPPWRLLERWPLASLATPGLIHVVGLPHVPATHRRVVLALAARAEVHLHLVEPGAPDHPLVTAWDGSAAAARAAWTAEAAAAGLETHVDERAAAPVASTSTLLGRLQGSLLRSGAAGAHGLADESLRVFGCGSPRREVEAVADAIWRRVQDSAGSARPVRFDEVAVVLPPGEAAVYAAHLEAVFAEAHDLPWTPRGLGRLSRGPLLEAAERLVDLPFGPCGRDDLLRLLVHPGLHGGDDDARGAWADWVDRLEVLRGFDRTDLADTYVERDLHSWDQGLRRLALGAFVPGARSGALEPVRIGSDDYLPFELPPDDLGSAGELVARARSLLADVRCAREKPRPLAAWARFLHALLQAHLRAASDDERGLLGRITFAARSLEELDPAVGAPVPYRVAAHLLHGRLAALAPFESGAAEQGVVVGPLEQVRGQRFRVAILLGFDEAAFPRGAARDVLDLRQVTPTTLDVSTRERDLRALLELLTATEEALLAVYTARDPQTGRELLPSVALVELGSALERTDLHGPDALAALTLEPRLRRFHPDHTGRADTPAPLPTALPEAHREARAAALGAHLRDALRATLPPEADLPAGAELLRRLAPEARARVADLLGLVSAPPTRHVEPVVRLSLRALRDFLLCPLQAWARHRLRLPEEGAGADPLEREDEVFAHGDPGRSGLLQSVLRDGLLAATTADAAPAAIVAAYERRALRAELAGETPTGLFGAHQRANDLAVLRAWHENLARALGDGGALGARPVRFGAAVDAEGGAEVALPTLALDVDLPTGEQVRVELHGATRLVTADRKAVVRLTTKDATTTYLLEAFVDHAVLAASGALSDGEGVGLLVVPGYPAPAKWGRVAVTPPFDRAGAREWLTSVLRDFLGGPHEVLLPAEACLGYLAAVRAAAEEDPPAPPPSLEEVLDGLVRRNRSLRSDHGPVQKARERFSAPVDGEAIAVRRHGPFDARCVAAAPAGEEDA